uniref:Ubiquitin-like domain-containing protein n=1 Tax=Opuntia streptacantha TaxID=393608 RepID=A0A7C9AT43_OPUST
MAEQHPTEGAGSSGASGSNSDSTVELNIKTLDSQIYKFHVDKNMPVSSFKGKIADQIGVPVSQQRLIFRGKVLKDDHLLSEYHVENGDTLHLVERQPTQPQTSSATGSADLSGNGGVQGNDGSAGAPRGRIGQISHSVVLGTLNVGDQGEGVVSDLTRVIGAVLNSLGVGSQATTNAAVVSQTAAPSNSSGPQGSDTEQGRGNTGGQSQASNQSQFGQPFLSQPFIPFTVAAVPPPTLNMPIPDSLNTMSEFMTHMEGVLSQNGYLSTPPDSAADQPATELPSNARGLPTPEALSTVLRHAQRLLGGHAVAALSHIAGRLEQDGGSTDESVRSQIQTDSVQVGLAMQHLGALLLELGRTILTLRMGRSPGEAVVNAGPAVYISPSGPNPIMVQPFPHQTSSLFTAASVSPPNTANVGSVGIIGNTPRNINIHIHAGTSLAPIVSAVGARAAAGDGAQGERSGATMGDPGANRAFPGRNVIAAAVPSRATITVSPLPNTSQPVGGVSTSQSSDAASLSSAIAEVNSRIRNLLGNMHTENQTPGQQENQSVPSSSASDGGSGEGTEPHRLSTPEPNVQEKQTERQENTSRHLGGEVAETSECNVNEGQKSCEVEDKSSGVSDVPLGLGGGLQPKRRSRQSITQSKSGEGGTFNSTGQSQLAGASGQEVLQTLASLSATGRMGSNDEALRQSGQGLGQGVVSTRGLDGQPDVTGMMSQVLQSPALNGLLSGVAQQTGVGSPDALRNMLQQFTQSPAMRNTLNNLVQQVDTEEIRDMFAGAGIGQDGGLDFSRVIQQMMPVVSQVLGGGPVRNERPQNVVPSQLLQFDDRSLGERNRTMGEISQNDLHEVADRIALRGPSRDIFSAVVQNAAEHSETAERELVDGLCSNEDLADEFLEMLRRDLCRRLEGGSGSAGTS